MLLYLLDVIFIMDRAAKLTPFLRSYLNIVCLYVLQIYLSLSKLSKCDIKKKKKKGQERNK